MQNENVYANSTDSSAMAPVRATEGGGYAFHDPDFLAWWLQSLYLLQPDDQVAVALSLRDVLNAPALQAEIDAFVDHRSEAFPAPVSAEVAEPITAPRVVSEQLRAMWHTRPWLLAGGLAALAYFVGGGVWFLGKEFARIVF